MTRVLVIDNYDSFTYNLVQMLGSRASSSTSSATTRRRSASSSPPRRPRGRVAGPCTPDDAGISLEAVRAFPEAGIPMLGVCLGHQSLGQAFGGTVVRHEPVHGKVTTIEHDGRTLYQGLPESTVVGRYHSLIVDEATLPDCFEVTSRGGGVIQGIRHKALPAEGVQFHPESVLTRDGRQMLANFLAQGEG